MAAAAAAEAMALGLAWRPCLAWPSTGRWRLVLWCAAHTPRFIGWWAALTRLLAHHSWFGRRRLVGLVGGIECCVARSAWSIVLHAVHACHWCSRRQVARVQHMTLAGGACATHDTGRWCRCNVPGSTTRAMGGVCDNMPCIPLVWQAMGLIVTWCLLRSPWRPWLLLASRPSSFELLNCQEATAERPRPHEPQKPMCTAPSVAPCPLTRNRGYCLEATHKCAVRACAPSSRLLWIPTPLPSSGRTSAASTSMPHAQMTFLYWWQRQLR